LRLSVSVIHRIGLGENTRLSDREDLFDTRDVATLVCRSLKSGSLGTSLSAAHPHAMLEGVRVAPSTARSAGAAVTASNDREASQGLLILENNPKALSLCVREHKML
jgi:hypothetical protein